MERVVNNKRCMKALLYHRMTTRLFVYRQSLSSKMMAAHITILQSVRAKQMEEERCPQEKKEKLFRQSLSGLDSRRPILLARPTPVTLFSAHKLTNTRRAEINQNTLQNNHSSYQQSKQWKWG